jgi:hypothetical protein
MKKFFVAIICGLLLIGASTTLSAQTIPVSGAVSSELLKMVFTPNGMTAQFKDTWTGSLEGHGHTHIFGTTVDPETGQMTATARIWLFTPQGNLIFDGVGTATGPFLQLVTTIFQGTGLYQNATGTSMSTGMIGPDGVESTYTGTITLAN